MHQLSFFFISFVEILGAQPAKMMSVGEFKQHKLGNSCEM